MFCFLKEYLKVTIRSTDYDRSKTKEVCGVFRRFWVVWYEMIQDVQWILIQGCHGESSIEQGEGSVRQQISVKLKEGTSQMLRLKHSFVLDTPESRL